MSGNGNGILPSDGAERLPPPGSPLPGFRAIGPSLRRTPSSSVQAPGSGVHARICRSAGAVLIVDEAHAIGAYGARGSGLIEACGVDAGVSVSVNTAGKALGVSGLSPGLYSFKAKFNPTWEQRYLVVDRILDLPPVLLAMFLLHYPELTHRIQELGRPRLIRA